MQQIAESFEQKNQSLIAERVVVTAGGGEARLRATIHRNAYDSQSYATVSQWTAQAGFQRIASVPIADTMLFSWSYTTRDHAWKLAASDDLDNLVEIGMAFVGATR